MNADLKKILEESKNVVLFTGAGISCGSGIPDFRSSNGLYSEKTKSHYSPEEIISHDFLMNKPELFYDFYFKKMVYPWAKPNSAHAFFAKLEIIGKLKAVITQNIDGLHSMAGNKKVYELHGSIYRNHCIACGMQYGLEYMLMANGVPVCKRCKKMVRPDVVLYGEPLDEETWSKAEQAVENADCLIVVGTSLTVYPAANMVSYFKGKKLVLINKQVTPYDYMADLVLHEDIEEVIKG